MIAERKRWSEIQQFDYVVGTDGSTWRVDAVGGGPFTVWAKISNAAKQTAEIYKELSDDVVRLTPTEFEALAVVRGVFPDAEEI
jgi:hypothetical protein